MNWFMQIAISIDLPRKGKFCAWAFRKFMLWGFIVRNRSLAVSNISCSVSIPTHLSIFPFVKRVSNKSPSPQPISSKKPLLSFISCFALSLIFRRNKSDVRSPLSSGFDRIWRTRSVNGRKILLNICVRCMRDFHFYLPVPARMHVARPCRYGRGLANSKGGHSGVRSNFQRL